MCVTFVLDLVEYLGIYKNSFGDKICTYVFKDLEIATTLCYQCHFLSQHIALYPSHHSLPCLLHILAFGSFLRRGDGHVKTRMELCHSEAKMKPESN